MKLAIFFFSILLCIQTLYAQIPADAGPPPKTPSGPSLDSSRSIGFLSRRNAFLLGASAPYNEMADGDFDSYLDSVGSVIDKMKKCGVVENPCASPLFEYLTAKNPDSMSLRDYIILAGLVEQCVHLANDCKCRTFPCSSLLTHSNSSSPKKTPDENKVILHLNSEVQDACADFSNRGIQSEAIPQVFFKKSNYSGGWHWLAVLLYIPGTALIAYSVPYFGRLEGQGMGGALMFMAAGFGTLIGAAIDIGGTLIITFGEIKRQKHKRWHANQEEYRSAHHDVKVLEYKGR
jgi:hypothetical protein